MTPTTPRLDSGAGDVLMDRVHLQAYAVLMLGERAWWLLSNYGRLMAGPNSGLYVSGVATLEAKLIVDALVKGETVSVHLMHRHRSGCYEASELKRVGGELVMLFADREEIA
jgi:hypothetical protein